MHHCKQIPQHFESLAVEEVETAENKDGRRADAYESTLFQNVKEVQERASDSRENRVPTSGS